MFIIKGLLDRVFFAAGVLIFMQAPNFVDQYTQRLGGFYQAQVEHLNQYQSIAQDQFNGDLEALISEFSSSGRQSVNQTAVAIQESRDQVNALRSELNVLETKQFVIKVTHLISNIRFNIARETAKIFTPAMPLTMEALVCGLFGGILFSIFLFIFIKSPKLFVSREEQSTAPVARRIEPSVTRSHVNPHKSVSRAI